MMMIQMPNKNYSMTKWYFKILKNNFYNSSHIQALSIKTRTNKTIKIWMSSQTIMDLNNMLKVRRKLIK